MLCAQLYLTFCNPMDCSLPSFSVHEIFQARTLEWVAISYSRESSWPRNETHVSCIGRQILCHYATWEAIVLHYLSYCSNCFGQLAFSVDSRVLWHAPSFVVVMFHSFFFPLWIFHYFLAWFSKLTLYFYWSSPRSSHFLEESWFFLLENGI